MPSRFVAVAVGCLLFGVFGLAGLVLGNFALSVLTLVFLFAFFGGAWNIMLGIAGQLSLGHALFAGIGGYSVAILALRFGISPWIGICLGIVLAAMAGAAIAWLSFRFEVRGVYFALLTIAFAEFTRIVCSGWDFAGGMAGLFFPAISAETSWWWLRGNARFFYYVTLFLALLGVIITAAIRESYFGYVWRAMRDDEDAARALGVRSLRHKIAATALSAGMTALGGGVLVLLQGSIFPDSAMGMNISIDILVGAVVGGLGTVLGPLIGALLVIPLAEAFNHLGTALGTPGLNSVVYGILLVTVVWVAPHGIWPAISRLLERSVSPKAGLLVHKEQPQ
jgi:branched-chain amino acid transport system permease protein